MHSKIFYPAGIGANFGSQKKSEQDSAPVIGNRPRLVELFYVLAGWSFLGSLYMCIHFWPVETRSIAFVWFAAGIVQAGMFAAVASILSYLNRIALSSEVIANNSLREGGPKGLRPEFKRSAQ